MINIKLESKNHLQLLQAVSLLKHVFPNMELKMNHENQSFIYQATGTAEVRKNTLYNATNTQNKDKYRSVIILPTPKHG